MLKKIIKSILVLNIVSLLYICGCSSDAQDSDENKTNDNHQQTDNTQKTCIYDEDCTKSQLCIGGYPATGSTEIQGKCMNEKDITMCVDFDNDGFSTLNPDYIRVFKESAHPDMCGTSEYPADPDDFDPNINARAKEICDGMDNNGDGCIDSKCMCDADDPYCTCKDMPHHCEAYAQPCITTKPLTDLSNTMCSASKAGAIVCLNGEMVYAIASDLPVGRVKDSIFYSPKDFTKVESLSSCPEGTKNGDITVYHINNEDFSYVENESSALSEGKIDFCDAIDHDCNGETGLQEAKKLGQSNPCQP